jgi:hypothetical protein
MDHGHRGRRNLGCRVHHRPGRDGSDTQRTDPRPVGRRVLRTPDEAARQRYDYTAPVFDFACRLLYDESGLVIDYPGIAIRAG